MLAAHALGKDRSHVLAHQDAELPEADVERLLQRREAGEPLAYILGWREFFGRRFTVRPGVLVPRQETETLVEACLSLRGVSSVLDIGTGSGIIAITLALERPPWNVHACDISDIALETARENAAALGAAVAFRQSDLFAAFGGMRFDLIVSNPPYLAWNEPLPQEVLGFEPPEALFAGETGVEFYRRLAEEAPRFLCSGGSMVLELGHRSLPEASAVLADSGWVVDSVVYDLGGLARCIVCRRPDR